MTEFSDIGFGFGCYHRNCHEKDENNNNEEEEDEDDGDEDSDADGICQYHDFDLKRAYIVIVINAIDGDNIMTFVMPKVILQTERCWAWDSVVTMVG